MGQTSGFIMCFSQEYLFLDSVFFFLLMMHPLILNVTATQQPLD